MPLWGWILLIAVLGGLLLAAVYVIAFGTRRARAREPLHGDPKNIAAPVPLDIAQADSLIEPGRDAEGEPEELSSQRE